MSATTKAEAAILNAFADGIASQQQAILSEIGTFDIKIEGEVVTLEGDAESKMNPVVAGLVKGACAALNPIAFQEIPTLEGNGIAALIQALRNEANKLNAAP